MEQHLPAPSGLTPNRTAERDCRRLFRGGFSCDAVGHQRYTGRQLHCLKITDDEFCRSLDCQVGDNCLFVVDAAGTPEFGELVRQKFVQLGRRFPNLSLQKAIFEIEKNLRK